MEILFVASFAPIVADPAVSQQFYAGTLGVDFEGAEGDYLFTARLRGLEHFGLWPLAEAARACFGTDAWPADVPVPQASVEFEVGDVAQAAAELEQAGYRLIRGVRTEPWGQVTARVLSPEGLLVGVCWTPWFHDEGATTDAAAKT